MRTENVRWVRCASPRRNTQSAVPRSSSGFCRYSNRNHHHHHHYCHHHPPQPPTTHPTRTAGRAPAVGAPLRAATDGARRDTVAAQAPPAGPRSTRDTPRASGWGHKGAGARPRITPALAGIWGVCAPETSEMRLRETGSFFSPRSMEGFPAFSRARHVCTCVRVSRVRVVPCVVAVVGPCPCFWSANDGCVGSSLWFGQLWRVLSPLPLFLSTSLL